MLTGFYIARQRYLIKLFPIEISSYSSPALTLKLHLNWISKNIYGLFRHKINIEAFYAAFATAGIYYELIDLL